MTDDDLIHFAAKKLGRPLVRGAFTWNAHRWGERHAMAGHFEPDWTPFDPLTSWALLGQGVDLCPHEIEIIKPAKAGDGWCAGGIYVGGYRFTDRDMKLIYEHGHVPFTFWLAWYRLEHARP